MTDAMICSECHCQLLTGHSGPCGIVSRQGGQWFHTEGVTEDDVVEAIAYLTDIRLASHWESMIPARFVDVQFSKLALPTDITHQLNAWIAKTDNCETNGSLLLFGSVGTGKTHTAAAVLRELIDTEMKVLMVSVVDMLLRLQPDGGGKLDDYVTPAFLLVDDLGIQKRSDWVDQTLFAIIDGRWREERPCLITSNLTPAELEQQIGTRCWDRLRHDAVAVHLPGASRRKAA